MTGGKDDLTMGVGQKEWLQRYQSNIQESKEKLNFQEGASVDERIQNVSQVMTEIINLELTLGNDKVLEKEPKESLLKSQK